MVREGIRSMRKYLREEVRGEMRGREGRKRRERGRK
jgi:hypothetical protein